MTRAELQKFFKTRIIELEKEIVKIELTREEIKKKTVDVLANDRLLELGSRLRVTKHNLELNEVLFKNVGGTHD